MKTFAIGDVHGNFSALQKLLERLPINLQTDELVFLGDLIDRGPNSKLVLDFVIELQNRFGKVYILKGNHEQLLLDSLTAQSNFDYWIAKGGWQTYLDYFPQSEKADWEKFKEYFPTLHLERLQQLLLFYKNKHALFVHAGARFTGQIWEIDSLETALYYRDFDFWNGYFGQTIVVGHTPTNKIRKLFEEPTEPEKEMTAWKRGSLIAIDCGAGQQGRLCALELPATNFYYENV
jgi:serine/threonine protein phosphatase 1